MGGGASGAELHKLQDVKLAHTADAAVKSTSTQLQKESERVQRLQQQMQVAKVGAKSKIAGQLHLAEAAEHAARSKDQKLSQSQQEAAQMAQGKDKAQSMANHLKQLLKQKLEVDSQVDQLRAEHQKLSDRSSKLTGDVNRNDAKMQQ